VFYSSRFTSQTGQGIFLGVLLILGGGANSAALSLSATLVALSVGSVFFGLPAGVVIDRLGAPRALFIGATLRLLVIAAALGAIGRAEYVPLLAFGYSSVSQLFSPSELALVRTLDRQGAGRAHATLIALQYGGQGAGLLLLAPALYALGGVSLMIAGAVTAYAIVVALTGSIALRLPVLPAAVRTRPALAWGDTISYIRREHHAAYAAGLLTFAEITTKSLAVALPIYLRDDLALSPVEVGVIAALGGTGVLLGLTWSGRSLTSLVAPRAMRIVLVVSVGSVFALMGLSGLLVTAAQHSQVGALTDAAYALNLGFVVAAPVALLLGLCSSIAPVGARTIFSETAPPAIQGRIFATQIVVTDVLVVAPLLAVGAMTGAVGPRASIAFVAAIGLALFLALEIALLRRRPALEPVPVRN
jgi:hypothetical protein